MPDKVGRLTGAEKTFAEAFARTGDRDYAKFKAGYKSDGSVSMALARVGVKQEIIQYGRAVLVNELYPASTVVLAAMLNMETPGVPWNARLGAAKQVRTEVGALAEGKREKDFADMTAEEIHAEIEKARQQLADRSKQVIEHETASAFE
jgi:hypothetical protein